MGSELATPINRHQRRRKRTRLALIRAGLKLFEERGYDATTIEDITDAADVSPRTFFHYFASKDEVLFGGYEERHEALIEVFLEEIEKGRSIASALRTALLTIIDVFEEDPDFFRRRAMLYTQWPALRSALLRVNDSQIQGLTAVLAEQLGMDAGSSLIPRLIAHLANDATSCAIDAWVGSEGKADLSALAEQAFDAVEPAITAALDSLAS